MRERKKENIIRKPVTIYLSEDEHSNLKKEAERLGFGPMELGYFCKISLRDKLKGFTTSRKKRSIK